MDSIAQAINGTCRPFLEEIDEASQVPNGRSGNLTGIAGRFGPNDAVLQKMAIVGAWKVDESGRIVGDFWHKKSQLRILFDGLVNWEIRSKALFILPRKLSEFWLPFLQPDFRHAKGALPTL